MGGCAGQQQKPSKLRMANSDITIIANSNIQQDKLKLDQSYKSSIEKSNKNMNDQDYFNQNQIENEDDDLKKSSIAISKIYRRGQQNMEDNTKNKHQQDDDQTDMHSKIYRNNKDNQNSEILLKVDQENTDDIVSGMIKQQEGFSKISIYNSNIAMEFTIPHTKAGPILVPYIDYDNYLQGISN